MSTSLIAGAIEELEKVLSSSKGGPRQDDLWMLLNQAFILATKRQIENLKIFEEDFSGSENEFGEMTTVLESTGNLIISLVGQPGSVQKPEIDTKIEALKNVIQNTEKELGIGSRIILGMKALLDSLIAIGNLLCVGFEKGLSLINGNVALSNELLGPLFKYETTTERLHDASVSFKGAFFGKEQYAHTHKLIGKLEKVGEYVEEQASQSNNNRM